MRSGWHWGLKPSLCKTHSTAGGSQGWRSSGPTLPSGRRWICLPHRAPLCIHEGRDVPVRRGHDLFHQQFFFLLSQLESLHSSFYPGGQTLPQGRETKPLPIPKHRIGITRTLAVRLIVKHRADLRSQNLYGGAELF